MTSKLEGQSVRWHKKKRNQEIMGLIGHLSKSLQVSVLAEFMETVEQRDKLAEIGCNHYQGYL